MNKRIGVIIQTRMTSTRLPGKVLKSVYDGTRSITMLEAVLERIKRSKLINCIIVATTTNETDNPVVELCNNHNILIYRGSENNVLERYYMAAKTNNLDIIIRITSDCPIIDVELMDEMLSFYLKNKYDYVSNTLERSYPRGLDIEIFNFNSLEIAYKNANTEIEKEHVTTYIYGHSKDFKLYSYTQHMDWSEYRLTVDTEKDMELIRKIYGSLYDKNPKFNQKDVLNLLVSNPEWSRSNRDIPQQMCSEQYFKSHLNN